MAEERRLRVVLAMPVYPPYHTGAGRRFLRYAPRLRALGVELEVLSATPTVARLKASQLEPAMDPTAGLRDGRLGEWLEETVIEGQRVRRVRLSSTASRIRAASFTYAVTRLALKERPDVLVFSPHALDVLAGVAALKMRGIATCIAYTVNVPLSTRRLPRVAQRLVWPQAFRAADAVVCNSDGMAQSLRGFGVSRTIDVIHNGVDLDLYLPREGIDGQSEARLALGLPPGRRIVLTVGAVSRRKGTEVLLEAFLRVAAQVPDVDLYLVGPSADGSAEETPDARTFAREVKALLEHPAFSDRVRVVGPREDVSTWMRAADIFAFASEVEGLPNAVLEAFASGLPVVSTTFEGLDETGGALGQPGRTFLLTPRDASALGAGLTRLLGDSVYAAQLAGTAREWVVDHHGLSVTVEAYAALFRRISQKLAAGR